MLRRTSRLPRRSSLASFGIVTVVVVVSLIVVSLVTVKLRATRATTPINPALVQLEIELLNVQLTELEHQTATLRRALVQM